MDQQPEMKEAKKFDLEMHSARTTTPLPGQRDSDLDSSTLPSARHAVKDEYSDYVKLAKSGGHQGKQIYSVILRGCVKTVGIVNKTFKLARDEIGYFEYLQPIAFTQ